MSDNELSKISNDARDSFRLNHPDDIKKYFSSKTFKDFLGDNENPLVYTTLMMDGKDFLEKSSYEIQLSQKTNDHDYFIIKVPDDSLDTFEGYIMEQSKNLLGKNVTLSFHRYGAVRQTFSGMITNIRNAKQNGYGTLYITVHSPSILLENGLDCQSWEDQTLDRIISDAVSEYPEGARVQAENLNTKYPIPYTVQYNESDFAFIQRLARRYGEYFYYNGQQLIFGSKVQPIVTLEENIDLIESEIQMTVKPQDFRYVSYDSTIADIIEKDSKSVQAQYRENPFNAIAVNASKSIFKKRPDMLFNATSHQKVDRDLEQMVIRQKESRQHLVFVTGKSRTPELRIGGRAKLVDINGHAMETYRILEITHHHDGNEYYNEFLGIPDIFVAPYFEETAYPLCEEQSATVVKNDNPQGMIKVQFPWQIEKGLTTPWLRVVTPYAGKGKGMHIIPEVGEEVIVGFDNGNAERPFVIGAMFNGKSSAGLGGAGNYMKGLQTPSGSRMQMNDKDGSLHLQDNGGVSMKFDGAGTSATSANKKHNVNVGKGQSVFNMDSDGNVIIDAKSSITLKVGENLLSIDKDGLIKINGKNLQQEAKENFDLNAKKVTQAAKGANFKINSDQNVIVSGGQEVKLK